jgi:hypothetical protein
VKALAAKELSISKTLKTTLVISTKTELLFYSSKKKEQARYKDHE